MRHPNIKEFQIRPDRGKSAPPRMDKAKRMARDRRMKCELIAECRALGREIGEVWDDD